MKKVRALSEKAGLHAGLAYTLGGGQPANYTSGTALRSLLHGIHQTTGGQ